MLRRFFRLLGSAGPEAAHALEPDASESTQLVRIAARKQEAAGIVSLTLVPDRRALAPFEAGSHVDVHIDHELVRQYSLCSDPSDHDRYRLGVLLEPASRGGSRAIHQEFQEGSPIRIGFPRNNFPLDEGARHSILVGGGIGITPLMAMAYRLQKLRADFELHYCVREPSRAAFTSELAARLGPRFSLHSDIAPAGQRFEPQTHLLPRRDGRLYVCGPPGFIGHVSESARALGWDPSCIRTEYFSNAAARSGAPFRIRTLRSGIEAEVGETETILEVLGRHGVEVPVSCMQGVCGTCLIPVVEGVPEHRDVFQSDEEKATNRKIAVCCSRAQSPVLVLDV